MKKAFLITGAVLVLLGLALFLGACASAGFDFSRFEAESEINTYTLDEEFRNIDVRVDAADVTFAPADGGGFRVVAEEREGVRLSIAAEDGTLKLVLKDERPWNERITVFSGSLSLTVYLPSEKYEALRIESVTGDVTVGAPFAFASAEVSASTGDVSWGASVDGSLAICTGTGKVRIENAEAGVISLSVSTGSVSLDSVTIEGALSISVGTGKTELAGVTCRSFASSGATGKITLKKVLVREAASIERSTGDVAFEDSDAGSLSVKTTTGSVAGTLSSEKIFSVKTTTGSVSVPDTTAGGRCEITTTTGSVRLSLTGR
ncbi:MAG: DUF4097 family beta strand repeat protein [Clostridia bacterium]|nr:DUF4097 family beta strand repeat protein [Clostridia bacterium]